MSKSIYPGIDYSPPGSTENRDPDTGIRFGVISQRSISPEVMDDIHRDARDLSYEEAADELKDAIVSAIDQGKTAREALRSVLSDLGLTRNRKDDMIEELMELGEQGACILDGTGDPDDCTTHKHEPNKTPTVDEVWEVVGDRFNDVYTSDGSHSWLWEEDGYKMGDCLDGDAFVFKSPYFTYTKFCSPCVPGAGDLDSTPDEMDLNSSAMASADLSDGQWDSLGIQQQHEHYKDAGWPKVFCLGHDFFEDGEAPYPVYSVATGKRVVMADKQEMCTACGGKGRLTLTSLAAMRGQELESLRLAIANRLLIVEDLRDDDTYACWRCGGLGYTITKVEKHEDR